MFRVRGRSVADRSCNRYLDSARERSLANDTVFEMSLAFASVRLRRSMVDFSSSREESSLSLWESVRRQVLAESADGRCRFVRRMPLASPNSLG